MAEGFLVGVESGRVVDGAGVGHDVHKESAIADLTLELGERTTTCVAYGYSSRNLSAYLVT